MINTDNPIRVHIYPGPLTIERLVEPLLEPNHAGIEQDHPLMKEVDAFLRWYGSILALEASAAQARVMDWEAAAQKHVLETVLGKIDQATPDYFQALGYQLRSDDEKKLSSRINPYPTRPGILVAANHEQDIMQSLRVARDHIDEIVVPFLAAHLESINTVLRHTGSITHDPLKGPMQTTQVQRLGVHGGYAASRTTYQLKEGFADTDTEEWFSRLANIHPEVKRRIKQRKGGDKVLAIHNLFAAVSSLRSIATTSYASIESSKLEWLREHREALAEWRSCREQSQADLHAFFRLSHEELQETRAEYILLGVKRLSHIYRVEVPNDVDGAVEVLQGKAGSDDYIRSHFPSHEQFLRKSVDSALAAAAGTLYLNPPYNKTVFPKDVRNTLEPSRALLRPITQPSLAMHVYGR